MRKNSSVFRIATIIGIVLVLFSFNACEPVEKTVASEENDKASIHVLVNQRISNSQAWHDQLLARAESMEKASDYGGVLEDGKILDGAGVLTTHAVVFRSWDYPRK